jgi:cysteine-rich repeat protein
MKRTFKALLLEALILIFGFGLVRHAAAQTGPSLSSAAFFGGPADQRGTGVAAGGGALYVSGDVQPETGNASDAALVLKYALPSGPSPVWARPYGFGTNFYAVAATNEGVYAGGFNYSLTTDGVGGKEIKSFLAKFAPDGSNGPAPGGATWLAMPHFFAYTGSEFFLAASSAVESGSSFIYAVGGGQPCSFSAYAIAKFDTSGSLLAKATDPGQEGAFTSCSFSGTSSAGFGVTVLNSNVYAVGGRGNPATIWKHAPNLTVVWRQQDPAIAVSQFAGVAAFGGAIYAVGNTSTGPNTEDYLIDKFDEAGTLLWRQTSGGANTDILTGVVEVGGRLFAVGYTLSSGAGGADSVVLEIDPATGATLSTTLFGGALDDKARGAATDGTDLYVVGESRSFASAEGNAVGQNDVTLLRYVLSEAFVCGDGVVEGAEQCDDGNTASGDCCSTTCQYEATGASCGSSSDTACDNVDTCNATGVCQANNEPNGSSCSDDNSCTQTDSCQSGACQGANPVVCTASDQCHDAGVCDAGTGVCSNPARADGSSCDDGDACTVNDSCEGEICTGGGTDPVCNGCGPGNTPPVVTGTTSSNPMPIGGSTDASVTASFTDAAGQAHTCSINWGDGSSGPDDTGTVSETDGSGTCTGSHTYAPSSGPVVYTVTVTNTAYSGAEGSGVTYVIS